MKNEEDGVSYKSTLRLTKRRLTASEMDTSGHGAEVPTILSRAARSAGNKQRNIPQEYPVSLKKKNKDGLSRKKTHRHAIRRTTT